MEHGWDSFHLFKATRNIHTHVHGAGGKRKRKCVRLNERTRPKKNMWTNRRTLCVSGHTSTYSNSTMATSSDSNSIMIHWLFQVRSTRSESGKRFASVRFLLFCLFFFIFSCSFSFTHNLSFTYWHTDTPGNFFYFDMQSLRKTSYRYIQKTERERQYAT